MEFELDSGRLDVIAPFAVVCSGDLVIERIGPSLRKALGRDLAGTALLEAFVIERPLGVATAAEIRARTESALLLRARKHDVLLRLQPVCPPNDDRIVLFGSVVLTNEADMSHLGLGVTDFAASDPTPDLLILKRTQERSLQDLAVLNAELERSASRLHEANAALTEAELRYRTLVEQHPLVTYVDAIDDRSSNIYTSPQIESLLGYSVEEWQGEPDLFVRVLHPDDRERVLAEIERTNDAETPYVDEYRLVARDGRVVWFRDESVLVYGEDGKPLHWQGYLLDITARRTAEDELRETSNRLRVLIESLRTGALLEDEHGRIAIANNVFCSEFRIATDPLQLVGIAGSDVAQQSKHLTADPERFATRIRETVERKEAVHAEEVEFADGRIFERDYVPILVEGVYRGHLWSYRDVTQRIEAQREIAKAHDEAVAASRAKTEFLATVSHEIRTPMHGVLGTVDLLEHTPLDADQAELVAIVRSSASALLAVINDILDLQRTETGHMELAHVAVDPGSLVAGVVDVIRAQADAKGLEVVVAVDEQIPQDLIGDPGRLRQILLNLVANAVKFTDTGRVSVSVVLRDLDDGSASLAFVVTDTGVGIPTDAQSRIFEPFAQADSTQSRHHEGTGLGLTITKQLVQLMEGAISLESVPGEGTTVTAVVGLRRGAAAVLPESLPVRRWAELAGTVLVAEDSPVNRELAARQLSRLGVTSRAVASGAAAVEALERGHYDLVLMDMRMPDMTGVEATRAIRAREAETGRPRATIVAMTANAMPENQAACLAAGMDDFATKPLLLDDLALVLDRWLPGTTPAPAAPSGAVPGPGRRVDTGGQRIAETLDILSDELGSVAAAHKVAGLWLAELPGRLDELGAAATAGDVEQLRNCAHTLKSTCALVGAGAASELAASVERRASRGEPLEPSELEALARAVEDAALLVRAWHETTISPAASE